MNVIKVYVPTADKDEERMGDFNAKVEHMRVFVEIEEID